MANLETFHPWVLVQIHAAAQRYLPVIIGYGAELGVSFGYPDCIGAKLGSDLRCQLRAPAHKGQIDQPAAGADGTTAEQLQHSGHVAIGGGPGTDG